ncbi:hypothetical protein T440DRAFT_463640, partial [Plenodomus tracheiphilus IPT5]
MAPTPVGDSLIAEPTSTAKPNRSYWTKNNIAVTIVFGLLFIATFAGLLLFYLYRRSQNKKKRKLSHHKSDHAGLLAHEDKTNMFSRHRASSVTLYVDSEADAHNKRASVDTMSLVPLQITPAEESHDPMNNTTESSGSGVSALSRYTHTSTPNSILLSPISPSGEDGDLGLRPAPAARARSTSTSSQRARYYESTPLNFEMTPIPQIVHSPS